MAAGHGLTQRQVALLQSELGAFARRFSFGAPIVVGMPTAMLRLADTSGIDAAYAVQVSRESAQALDLDRIEIRKELRGRRLGSCLYLAVERWARTSGIRELRAWAQGSGAPLAASVGFDFEDHVAYRELVAARGIRVDFRYPFEVLAFDASVVDGYGLLRQTGFDAIRRFDVDTRLEAQAAHVRAELEC